MHKPENVTEFPRQLGSFFGDFQTYPATVQLAMLDMAYTMGTKKFFEVFKRFRAALAGRNWIRVAAESKRSDKDANGNPIQNMPRRNKVTKDWILEAIRDEPFFINPDCPPKRLDFVS